MLGRVTLLILVYACAFLLQLIRAAFPLAGLAAALCLAFSTYRMDLGYGQWLSVGVFLICMAVVTIVSYFSMKINLSSGHLFDNLHDWWHDVRER